MSAPKKKPAPRAVKPAAPTARKQSRLTLAGDEASRLARRTLLVTTCSALKWNLTRVAEVLDLATPSDVIRALKELAPDEYEAAQGRGDVRRGSPARES